MQTPTSLFFHGATEVYFRRPLNPEMTKIYHVTARKIKWAPSISAQKSKKTKGPKDGDLHEKQMLRIMKVLWPQ